MNLKNKKIIICFLILTITSILFINNIYASETSIELDNSVDNKATIVLINEVKKPNNEENFFDQCKAKDGKCYNCTRDNETVTRYEWTDSPESFCTLAPEYDSCNACIKATGKTIEDDTTIEENNNEQANTNNNKDYSDGEINACENPEILKIFYFFNIILDIVRIAIPIGLIIIGTIDFTKALISSDESTQKKSTKLFMKRILMGIMVFLVPWIVKLLIIGLGNIFSDEVNFTDCLENANSKDIERLEAGLNLDNYKCYYDTINKKYNWIYYSGSGTGPSSEFTLAPQYKTENSCLNANK